MEAPVLGTLACNLCGDREATVVSHRSRDGGPLRTVACRSCGLVRSDPRPHDVRRFYEDEYRLAYKGAFEPHPKHVLRAGKVALSRLEKIRPLLRERLRILDVGSGGGEFAYLLKTLGHDVRGIEPNAGYANYAAAQYDLDVRRGFVDDALLESDAFDLITIWHVLEHTEDPLGVLRRLRAALRPAGRLVVEVPNVEATCQSPASRFHEAHLFDFGPRTLEAIAGHAGLRVLSLSPSPDGGNLTAVLEPAAEPDAFRPLPPAALRANHDRVVDIVRRHTNAAHFLSPHPYRRFVHRMARAVAERHAVRRPLTGRARLDALYRDALGRTAADRPAARRVQPLWPWVAASYALALLLEWLLLDPPAGQAAAGEPGRLALYVAVQVAVVTVVLKTVWRPTAPRQYATAAGWALPLFLLPGFS